LVYILPYDWRERERVWYNMGRGVSFWRPIRERGRYFEIYAADLSLAAAFRTSKRLCFFNTITLNLSKSVNSRLLSRLALFLAHAVSAHFDSTPSFSQTLVRAPVPAPRGRDDRTMLVRVTCLRAIDWRGTFGASMRTYKKRWVLRL